MLKDQMEMNFALGGRAETVDPVSGNDVPPGSLPVEVRDDIPARLSEGEYVVPADVVRYFGVRVFEEMRMEAKMGLQQMDADGRIGGEPIAAEPSDMISDEELAQLDDMLSQKGMAAGGLAQGGMIDRLVNMARTNPVVNERIKAAGIPVEMALGGSVGVGIPSNSQNVDPRKVDEVIAKIGVAAQQNPELMRMLGERGINVPRTTAMQTPQQMQQANSPAATTNPLMSGKSIAANAGGLMGYQEGGTAAYMAANPLGTFNPEQYETVGGTYVTPDKFVNRFNERTQVPVVTPPVPASAVAAAPPVGTPDIGQCGANQRWDGFKCVVESEGPDPEPDDPVPTTPFGENFNEGKGVNWADPSSTLDFASSLETGLITDSTRTGLGAAAVAVPALAPFAAAGAVYGKLDATRDYAGLKATRLVAAALGQTENVAAINAKMAGYESTYGKGLSGSFGVIGTGHGYSASVFEGATAKEMKELEKDLFSGNAKRAAEAREKFNAAERLKKTETTTTKPSVITKSVSSTKPAAVKKENNGGGDNGGNSPSAQKTADKAKASKTEKNLSNLPKSSEGKNRAEKAARSSEKDLESQYGLLNKGGLMRKQKKK